MSLQNNQKRKLDAGKERLAALKYHPLRDHQVDRGIHDRGVKRKKSKECSSCLSMNIFLCLPLYIPSDVCLLVFAFLLHYLNLFHSFQLMLQISSFLSLCNDINPVL